MIYQAPCCHIRAILLKDEFAFSLIEVTSNLISSTTANMDRAVAPDQLISHPANILYTFGITTTHNMIPTRGIRQHPPSPPHCLRPACCSPSSSHHKLVLWSSFPLGGDDQIKYPDVLRTYLLTLMTKITPFLYLGQCPQALLGYFP